MEDDQPLPQYAALAGTFGAVLGGFLLLAGRRLPERVSFSDTVRIGLASYKLGRLVAKDRVTAFVRAPVTEDEEGTRRKFEIVGEDEADAAVGKLSWVSPLARALTDAKKGDAVVWKRPAGDLELEILSITYPK